MSTATPATIRVSGHAAVATEPDEAFVWITLQENSDAPGSAFEAVAARSERLSGILDEMGIAAKDRAATGVSVGEEFDHTPAGRKSLGYVATASVSVRLVERHTIGELMKQVTGELDARVAGPRWQVSPDNPAWLEAAEFASTKARLRAKAYAAGVGARLGRLVSLSEPDHNWAQPKMIRTAALAPGGTIVDPGEQDVTASVEAVFELDVAG